MIRYDLYYRETGHSLAGLIRHFSEIASPEAADYFFFGVTVQDVTDTATSLALQEAGDLIKSDLVMVNTELERLVATHKQTYMLGRTHGQAGGVITFGYKCAVFLAEFQRHAVRFEEALRAATVLQFGGAVGGLNSLGPNAIPARRLLAERLNLHEPEISWTNSRDNLYAFFNVLNLISGTSARLGHELYNLQRTGIEELCERQSLHHVHSVSMPHKRNPEDAEQIGALAAIVRGLVQALTDNSAHEHERDGKSWKAEWACVPLILGSFLRQSRYLGQTLSGLEVNAARMAENISQTRGHCFSDSLLFALAARVGLRQARSLVAVIYQSPSSRSQSLEDLARSSLKELLSETELKHIFSLDDGTQNCVKMCDLVLAARRGKG